MDLSQLLIAARGADANARKAAEDALGKLREQNLVRSPVAKHRRAQLTRWFPRACCCSPFALSSPPRAVILCLVVLLV